MILHLGVVVCHFKHFINSPLVVEKVDAVRCLSFGGVMIVRLPTLGAMLLATDAEWVRYSSICMVAAGFLVFLVLIGAITAPYGRYSSDGSFAFGCKIPARLSWIIMESPPLLVPIFMYRHGFVSSSQFVPKVIFGYFIIHYIHRSLIFPFRMKAGAPMPILISLFALFYTAWNGATQAVFFLRVASYSEDWLLDPRFIFGSVLFFLGMAMNIHSDSILLNLRKPGETGYKIPRGGMFEYVSAANYGAEIIEWIGFAIASWSLPGLAFAVFTFCNTGPRGYKHHQWYLQKFKDYPKNRKAVIPLVW